MQDHSSSSPAAHSLATFTSIVDRHQHMLHSFLHGLTGDVEQARDLMQDTFQDAWSASQRGAAPFVATGTDDEMRRWLFQAAYHRAISALRRRRLIRWESLDAYTALGSEPGKDAGFEDQIAEREALRAALARLAPPDRACLLLRVVQGFSAAEVGKIVGASAEVVAKRLSRAKQRLRAAYCAHDATCEEHCP